MRKNNSKFFYLLKFVFVSVTLFAMLFAFQLFPLKTKGMKGLAGESSGAALASGYDYVLVIDESGSMKRNDPANIRVDAAKLFVYLAETMNSGNRVLVSGFGETTNIYQPLTEISGNEKIISASISKIQSNQDLTDMKGALTKIKQILDLRVTKKKTVVIFLTDGSLTINDIPAQGPEEAKPPRETPETTSQDDTGRTVKYKEKIQQKNIKGPEYTSPGENQVAAPSQKDYLDNYKKELIGLCYNYKSEGITIYPIAFTQEADLSLLEQMAGITGGICWQAKEAKDIRVSFIEILKNVTSRFIKIEEQAGPDDLSSVIPVGSYIKDLIVIGIENNFNSVPQIKLTAPSGNDAIYDEYIEESLFKIAKVISPREGDWVYKIKGDAIFVYDIMDAFISEPQYPVYTSDAVLPLKLDILKNDPEKLEKFVGDFKISAKALDPAGNESANADLSDDGSNTDSKAGDGIFTGSFKGQSLKGSYTFNFLLNHIPTGSVASKNITLEFVELPGKITVLEPSGDNYNFDEPVTVQVRLDKNEKINQKLDPLNYKLTFSLTDPSGIKAQDLVLSDNGQGADKQSGDGIYSATLINTTLEGFYEIEFFIRDASVQMTVPACTGIKAGFNLSKASPLKIAVENNLFVTGSTIIRANFEDKSPAGEFKYFITAPDGSESSGVLADDGNAVSGDLKAADGVASIILPGPGNMGPYKIRVQAEYKTEAGETIPVLSETTFSKELSISKSADVVSFAENSVSAQAGFKVLSQAASSKQIAIDMQKYSNKEFDNNIIKSVKINGNKTLDAGSESSIVLVIELEDDVKSGNYKVVVPFIVDENSMDSVMFDVSVPESAASYFLWIIIGAVLLAIVIIVLFVYLLYIRPKKRGY